MKRKKINDKNIDKYITNKQLTQLVNSFFNLPKTEVENEEENKKSIKYIE